MSAIPPLPPGSGGEDFLDDPACETLVLRLLPEDLDPPRIGGAMEVLLPLTERPERVRQFRQRLLIDLAGLGEGRLLDQHRALRAYLQALDKAWPYWLAFLALEEDQWSVLMRCVLPEQDPAFQPGCRHSEALAERMAAWSTAHFRLHEYNGVPHEEGDDAAESGLRMAERVLVLAGSV